MSEYNTKIISGAFSAATVLAIISLNILLIIQIVFKKKGVDEFNFEQNHLVISIFVIFLIFLAHYVESV